MGTLKVFRYYSMMNPWIDFAILTFEDFADKARDAINAGLDLYWGEEGEDLCYMDAIALKLMEAGVPFYDICLEDEDENELWEAIMEKLEPEYLN